MASRQHSAESLFSPPSNHEFCSAVEPKTMTNCAPAPPPPLPPPPPSMVSAAATDRQETMPTPRSRLRRLQWVKIPAGRVHAAGGGRNVWTDVGDRHRSDGTSPPTLDFSEMEELFRVAEPSPATANGPTRQRHRSQSPSTVDKQKNRDEVRAILSVVMKRLKDILLPLYVKIYDSSSITDA